MAAKKTGLRITKVTFGKESLDVLLEKALSPYFGNIEIVKLDEKGAVIK